MKYTMQIVLLTLVAGMLGACGGSGNGPVQTRNAVNALTDIAGQDANSEPDPLDDAVSVEDDILTVFGDADGVPTEVEDGDTAVDVIRRAGR